MVLHVLLDQAAVNGFRVAEQRSSPGDRKSGKMDIT